METETIEAPVEELSRDSLLDAAHEADMTEYSEDEPSAQTPEPAQPVTETPATAIDGTKPDNSETEAEKEQRKRDEKGRFVPKEAKKEEKPVEPVKEDSAFTKAQKEQDRQKNLLANFQAEKERVRAEFAAESQRLAQERSQLQQATRPRAEKQGFTAQEYAKSAQDWEAQALKAKNAGDNDTALKYLEAAWAARGAVDEIRAFEWQATQKQGLEKRQRAFLSDMDSVYKEHPEAKYDPANPTPLTNQIAAILEAHPYVDQIPKGFNLVYDMAQKMIEAASVSELRTKNKELQAEVERLNRSTQPARGGPTGHATTPKFDSMSQAEQREALIRASAEADQMEDAA